MRGHIARKGNRYYAVVYEGINPKTGKPRHRWYAGGATRREAEKVLTDLVKRVHDGDYRSPERITLGAYLTERWIPLRKSQVRLSTRESFRRTIDSVKPEAIRRLFSAEKPNPTLTTLVALAGALDLEILPTPRRSASPTRARSAASGTRRRSA